MATPSALRKEANAVAILIGKAMAHAWMPKEAVQALSAVSNLLTLLVDRIEKLEQERER